MKNSELGFSLTELLVVVSILGIAAAISIPSFLFVLRRERVNAIALEAAGWLEEARSQSAREVNLDLLALNEDDSNKGGCAIVLGVRIVMLRLEIFWPLLRAYLLFCVMSGRKIWSFLILRQLYLRLLSMGLEQVGPKVIH
jgi:prepilin-type N-terminal cleavage/methylation domain-containing protein